MIKAVIFDVDGVLLDNTQVFLAAFRETADLCGLKFPAESEVKKLFGMPWYEMLEKMYGRADEEVQDTYSKVIEKFHMKKMADLDYVLGNIRLRKAIMTSKSKRSLENHLGYSTEFFEVIVTRDDSENHKPDPEPLLLACKRLCIKPQEAVYVGDSVVDYQTAKAAGTNFIGMVSGATTKEEFNSLHAKSVSSLKELLGVLDENKA
jgi:pyrophosphatase PpaX